MPPLMAVGGPITQNTISACIVLAFTTDAQDHDVYAMQQAGAFEVLHKEDALKDLYAVIQRAGRDCDPIGSCSEQRLSFTTCCSSY